MFYLYSMNFFFALNHVSTWFYAYNNEMFFIFLCEKKGSVSYMIKIFPSDTEIWGNFSIW